MLLQTRRQIHASTCGVDTLNPNEPISACVRYHHVSNMASTIVFRSTIRSTRICGSPWPVQVYRCMITCHLGNINAPRSTSMIVPPTEESTYSTLVGVFEFSICQRRVASPNERFCELNRQRPRITGVLSWYVIRFSPHNMI